MRYFLIAGEASGDLHAARLMLSLREADPAAEFRCYGGDEMQRAGGTLLCHYRHLAYMGFVQVVLHARTILRGLSHCKAEIAAWKPDAVILVDYPGFNLKVARFVKRRGICPVFYYISPKIWAWKEGRIRAIRRDVSRLFSILPFEVDFFEKKHGYPISYVGNPTVDEVAVFRRFQGMPRPEERTLALLPGSRRQEVADNLRLMLCAAGTLEGWKIIIAAAPAIGSDFYRRIIRRAGLAPDSVELVSGETYSLLNRATAAMVTSGTATLETALFHVPQVVCYFMRPPRLVRLLRPHFLHVPYISLVNLIAGREVVPELVGADMNVENARRHLLSVLPGGSARAAQLEGYALVEKRLGGPGAPQRAAHEMVARLRGERT